MHLKNNKRSKKIKKLFVLTIAIFTIQLLFGVTKRASNLYMSYALIETERLVTNIINDATTNNLLEKFQDMSLYDVTFDKNGNVLMIDYNSLAVNVILKDVTDNIQSALNTLEDSDSNIEVPILSLFNNPIINNYGPKIKVKIQSVGKVNTKMISDVKDYGINNSLIELSIYVEVKQKVVLPIISKEINVINKIPFSYKIVSGKVPDYYGGYSLGVPSLLN